MGLLSPDINTPEPAKPVNTRQEITYENTKINEHDFSTDVSDKVEKRPFENYTDVPDPLPAFLRNNEMLMVPEATEERVNQAQKDFDQSYARLSKVIPSDGNSNPPINSSDADYMDPQDARDKAATDKTHEKLDKRVSKSKHSSEARSSTTTHEVKRMPADSREDYTLVSDALPEGPFSIVMETNPRARTTSDVSPVKRPNLNLKKKSESLKRPEHFSDSKSQPVRRRSTAKEMVTYDPKAGFKLSAHRTSSDGTPQFMRHEAGDHLPSDPQVLAEEDKNSTHIPPPDVGCKHIYAAVDLTAKCRPESDLIRREGVGTPPDHYVACV